MTQSIAIAISVVFIILTITAFWFFMFHGDFNEWVAIGVPVLVLILMVVSLFWSFNDNFYDVKSGVVVDQKFTAAHQNPPTIISTGKSTVIVPGVWVADDWAIEIRGDNGATGWIHFSNNVFSSYPDGSTYPR